MEMCILNSEIAECGHLQSSANKEKYQSLLHFWTLNRENLWYKKERKFWELKLNFGNK